MSTFTPLTLSGTVSSISGQTTYGENDGTGMSSQFQTYEMTLSITAQATGDGSSRKANEYNGIDIGVGMWVSGDSGESVLRIKSISAKSPSNITLIAEDVDMLSYRLNSSNSLAQSQTVIIFNQNAEGEALLTEIGAFQTGGVDKVQSRFLVNEADDRVKFAHDSAPSVETGDVVTINSDGNLVKYGTAGGSDIKVGTVLDIIRGGKDVFIKPFNDIIRNYKDPEALTANPGQIYYTDTNNAGEITTNTGGKASYLHLNTAVASSQVVGTATPGTGDTVILNGVTVFDGPNGDTVADLNAFRDLINTFTSTSHVSATSSAVPVSVQGGDFAPNFEGNDYYAASDSYIVTGAVGGSQDNPQITLSDGVTTSNITFDNPDDTMNVGGTDYNVISATAILSKINDAISNDSLNLSAETFTMSSYDGDSVRITTTDGATAITITNVTNGAFGTPAFGSASWTGIGVSATVGSPTMTLTRSAGGPIEITGSPISSGWINSGGAVSSNSGRVPYLLLIESEGGGGSSFDDSELQASIDSLESKTQAVGVMHKEEITPSATTADEDSTGGTITYTPFEDSDVTVRVNGLQCDIGNGAKNEPCYFSADGGTTARAIADITAGDTLYWMGSVAGYELDATDDLDISYQASSDDV